MDDQEQNGGFRVRDKRRFTAEGETRQDSEDTGTAGPGPHRQETGQETRRGEERGPAQETPGAQEPPPPVDFPSFVLSLANSALFQLGLVKGPDGEANKDTQAARQLIDIIAMLEQKTKGNLTEEEAKLVSETLFQLRMAYVEATK